MGLPETYTMVRHGQSEANVLQSIRKQNVMGGLSQEAAAEAQEIPEEVFSRHDSHMRLTELGVQQAIMAGEWLKENVIAAHLIDRFYVSPHARTRETAGHLKLGGNWAVDDRFRERDWGEITSISRSGGEVMSEQSMLNKKLSEWYWVPQAGESMATGVRGRVESIMNSLYRSNSHHVLAVTHGEFIRASQFVIENMTPDQWETMDEDEAFKMQNTMIVQYTRRDPSHGADLKSRFSWRRAICPWDDTKSWNNGQWTPITTTTYSDDDLLSFAEQHPRLLPTERGTV